jgi:hypothetical protein
MKKPREILTEKFLTKHYIEQRKSAQTIARESGLKCVGTVEYAIKKHGLYRESLLNSVDVFTKEFLEKHYVQQNLSMNDVAALGGFKGNKSVAAALDRYGIPHRKSTQSQKRQGYYDRKRSHHTISRRYFNMVECGAIKRKLSFNISIDEMWDIFIAQDGKCKLSRLPIRFHISGESPTTQTASLDRIDSNLGYSVLNCQWLHKKINIMKLDHDQDEFINLCSLVARNV